MYSYPTPAGAAHEERMNDGFLKLHPGAPVHVFKHCHDEHFHTHPFPFTTHIVEVGYREEVLVVQPDGTNQIVTLDRLPGTSHDMPLDLPHRLVGLLSEGVGITRCEYGPNQQKPGFVRLLPDGRAEHRYHDEPDTCWRPWPLAA